MKVKICSDCGIHNPPDAWNCAQCGHTLSVNTLAEVDHLEETPSAPAPHENGLEDLKEIILYRSEDAFITSRQVIIPGEPLRVRHIASVEKVITTAEDVAQDVKGERRPRPEDLFIISGLAARTIRSMTGIGSTRYMLRIHLQSGRVHEYVSRSEDAVDAMLAALKKAITQRP